MFRKDISNDKIDKEEDIVMSLSPRISLNPSNYQRSKTPITKYQSNKEIRITVIKTPRKNDSTISTIDQLFDNVTNKISD